MEFRQRRIQNVLRDAVATNESSAKNNSQQTITLEKGKLSTHWYFLGRFLLLVFLVLYVIIPLLIHYSSTVQRNIIFLSLVRWPLFIDLTKPELLGLPNTRNFYITTDDNVKLGAWHVLPTSLDENVISGDGDRFYENSLKNGLPIILYLHGNSGTRGGPHRVQLYQVLRRLNYHVIAFDYRGYADSSNAIPSENGVVSDARFVYKWLQNQVGNNSNIIIWGHSLGTGVATKLLKEQCINGNAPSGLVLEAPFNNLRDEIKHHPFTYIYRFMPYFEEIFLDAVEKNIAFLSDENIRYATLPILILHAEDDTIIPIQLGRMLYESALLTRPENAPSVSFHTFDAEFGYGHRFICKAPDLPQVVSEFVSNNCQKRKE